MDCGGYAELTAFVRAGMASFTVALAADAKANGLVRALPLSAWFAYKAQENTETLHILLICQCNTVLFSALYANSLPFPTEESP